MDARNVVLPILIGLTSLSLPEQLRFDDFRSNIRIEKVSIHRGSPVVAAWEDSVGSSPRLVIAARPQPSDSLRVGASLRRWIVSQKKIITAPKKIPIIVAPSSHLELAQVDAETFTMSKVASALVQAELSRRRGESLNLKKISTPSGSAITVAAAKSGENRLPATLLASVDARPAVKIPERPQLDRALLSGTFQLANGAALLGSGERVIAYHKRDGRIVSEGFVNAVEGSYRIEADGLDGQVVAEILSSEGELLARGERSLLEIAHLAGKGHKFNDLEIVIKPVTQMLSANIYSATQPVLKQMVGARLFIDGIERAISYNKQSKDWRDTTIAAASQYMYRAEEPSHRATVAWAEAGKAADVRLYPASYVQALLELTLGKYAARDNENAPLIWGKVVYSGKPISGAMVDLVGEDAKATYFSGFLPDAKLDRTSTGGEYAFVGADRGEKVIQVKIPGVEPWPIMVPSYERTISQADIEISPAREIEFKSYDPFTQESIPTVFSPMGLDQGMAIGPQGAQVYQVQTARGLTFVEAEATAEFLPIRTQVRNEQSEVHFPQLRREWMKKLAATKGLTEAQMKNSVVGFVDGDDFEVVFGSGGSFVDKRIVYFDESGRESSEHGRAGGGFIVFDVPTGLQTITIFPSRGKTVLTQVVYADQFATHILRVPLTL